MTVDDLIQQQASKHYSSSEQSNIEEYQLESLEDQAIFKAFHLKGYARGNGFNIQSF